MLSNLLLCVPGALAEGNILMWEKRDAMKMTSQDALTIAKNRIQRPARGRLFRQTVVIIY